jgi:hypothetical protein
MHWTDYARHHSFNTVIKNNVRTRRLIIVILNPEKIVNSDVKCRSLWCTRMRSNRWSTLLWVRWSHVALWEHFLQEGIQSFVMEQSDKEYSPWFRFNGNDYCKALDWVFQWYLLKLCFVQSEMKSQKVQKWYIM